MAMADTQTGPIALFYDRVLHMRGINAGSNIDLEYCLGITLIACGILGLAVYIWENRRIFHGIWRRGSPR